MKCALSGAKPHITENPGYRDLWGADLPPNDFVSSNENLHEVTALSEAGENGESVVPEMRRRGGAGVEAVAFAPVITTCRGVRESS